MLEQILKEQATTGEALAFTIALPKWVAESGLNNGWQLAAVGGVRLAADGGWQLVLGGGWRLAVGGPCGLSLRKKHNWGS